MLQKTNNPDFYRDESSHALINTNVTAYRLYKEKRDSDKNVSELSQKVNQLTSELGDIKALLKELLEKKNV